MNYSKATPIKITRLSDFIYPSRDVVMLALDNVYHLIGQFILADYTNELGKTDTILVIGKLNGTGRNAYSVISTAGDFVVNKVEIPDVSQVGHQDPEIPHGEIYISKRKIDLEDEESEEDWFLVSCPVDERVWEIIDRSRIFRNLDDGYRWFYIKETRTLKREDDFLSTYQNEQNLNIILNNLDKPSMSVYIKGINNNQPNKDIYLESINETITDPIFHIIVRNFSGEEITEDCTIKINNRIIEPEEDTTNDFLYTGSFNTDSEFQITATYLENTEIKRSIKIYFPSVAYYGTCNLINNEVTIDEEDIRTKLIYSNSTDIDVYYNLNRNRSILLVPQEFGEFHHIFDINELDYIKDYTFIEQFEYDGNIYSAYYKNSIVIIENFRQRFVK